MELTQKVIAQRKGKKPTLRKKPIKKWHSCSKILQIKTGLNFEKAIKAPNHN
jgi:hypothetical protein